jgi:hypothetical protein
LATSAALTRAALRTASPVGVMEYKVPIPSTLISPFTIPSNGIGNDVPPGVAGTSSLPSSPPLLVVAARAGVDDGKGRAGVFNAAGPESAADNSAIRRR